MSDINPIVIVIIVVAVFGVSFYAIGTTQNDVGDPEITEFEDLGSTTNYTVGGDTWEVTTRDNGSAVIEGTTVQRGDVDSLEAVDVERTENNTVIVTLGVNKDKPSPTNVHGGRFVSGDQVKAVDPYQPIPSAYNYSVTIDNVRSGEDIVVEVVDMDDSTA